MKKDLAIKIDKVEALSNASKLNRFLNNPFKYTYAILLKNAFYPIFRREKLVTCKLFTGKKIKVVLPASTDIFLTGGKSHSSEIRLARFLILNLSEKNVFWDIGAHYGYFTMLASSLVGAEGKVISIEASPSTFKVLKENAQGLRNISPFHNAVSDSNQKISFFELPNLYSEYNTTDITQFEKEEWFKKNKPNKVEVDSITLDSLLLKDNQIPDIIKIDAEGGELAIIKGGANLLQTTVKSPIIIMEYLEPKRNNQAHKQAHSLLKNEGFYSHIIIKDGSLELIEDIELHLSENNLESDNIVFKKLQTIS